jgi:hypothetical protein
MAHITIDDIAPLISYTVGGSPRSEFPIPFAYFATSNIVVTVGDETLVSSDYTITGTAVDSGFSDGTVTLDDAVTDTVVVIERILPIERTTDFPLSGPFDTRGMNTELDKIVAICQQLEQGQSTFASDVAEAEELFETLINADTTVTLFSTRTAITLANVDAGTGNIRTAGYAAVGDGGEALYKRKGSEPSHPGKVQSLNGVWFELVGDVVNAAALGVHPDNADNYLAMSDAIGYAKAAGRTLVIPSGHNVINMSGVRASIDVSDCRIVGSGSMPFWRGSAWAAQSFGERHSWFDITGISDSPFTTETETEFERLGFLYPDQVDPTNLIVYPETISSVTTSKLHVHRCTFANPTIAINVHAGGFARITECGFSASNTAIVLGSTFGECWIKDNDFSNTWPQEFYTYLGGTAFTDWQALVLGSSIAIGLFGAHNDAVHITDNVFAGFFAGIYGQGDGTEGFLWANISNNTFDHCLNGLSMSGLDRPSEVTIVGNHFDGTNSASCLGVVISLTGAAPFLISITGNRFGGTGSHCVYVSTTNAAQSGDVAVTGNIFNNPGFGRTVGSYYATYVQGGATNLAFSGNIVNGFTDPVANGVGLGLVRSANITGNIFRGVAFGIDKAGGIVNLNVVGNTGDTVSAGIGGAGAISGISKDLANSWN